LNSEFSYYTVFHVSATSLVVYLLFSYMTDGA